MSGTTFTWLGGTSSDWTDKTNWSTTTVPNATNAVVIVNTPVADAVIAAGANITVDTLTVSGAGAAAGQVVVGGSDKIGSGGGGSLKANSLTLTSTDANGALVGGPGGVVTATTMTIGAGVVIGGGGTFDVGTIVNDGLIQADGARPDLLLGSVIVNGGTVSGAGHFEIDNTSTLEINAATSQEIVANVGTTDGAALVLDNPANFKGSISLSNPSSHLNLFFGGKTPTGAKFDSGSASLIVTDAGGGTIAAIPFTSPNTVFFGTPTSTKSGFGEVSIVCYARGTRIDTPAGEVAVEDLAEGDLVLTASGEPQPISWIGRRHLDCTRHPAPAKVWPIRIKAGAFGPSMPQRDLLVSPQHAIFDEGVLIPAKYLVNGTSVVVEHADTVEYYHIELPRHDLLLAEGLPAESYLENGDRSSFENGGGAMQLHPDFSNWTWDSRACAELKVTGPEVDRVKAKLARFATRLPKPAPARASKARKAASSLRGATAMSA